MKYLMGMISFTTLKLNMVSVSKALLQKGLVGKIGYREPALSVYLRNSSHGTLLELIEGMGISDKYKSYLKATVYKHEKNYKESRRLIRSMDDAEIIKFKTKLLYDMKDISALGELSNKGADILKQLNMEQRMNLISYLTARNMYDLGEQMLQQTDVEKDHLIEQLKADRENVYLKYSLGLYRRDVLGLSADHTLAMDDVKELIDMQDHQMKNLGYILLINHHYRNEEKAEWLNENVVPYFKDKMDLYQYIEPEALHFYDFEIDQDETRALQLQRILNYYHLGSHSKQMRKSMLRLIPQVNLNTQHLMSLRRMLLDGQLEMNDQEFQELCRKDRRLHAIFHYAYLFLNSDINKEIDAFVHFNLNLRDRRRIYNQVIRQLIHTKDQMMLPKYFVEYLQQSHVKRLSNSYILSRHYYAIGATSEREKLIRSKGKDKQFKIRLYLAKLLFYRKRYQWSLYETRKASEIRGDHPDVIRNFIRNYHVAGNITERYNNISKMKKVSPNKLYHNEYEMAKQEFELSKNEWQLKGSFSDGAFVQESDNILFVLNKSLPVLNGYTIRSHEIIKRVRTEGYNPIIATRLGWTPEQDGYEKPEADIDGIPTYYIGQKDGYTSNKTPLIDYFDKYAEEIRKIIQDKKPSIIHAASNFQNALPALKVGKALGISTIYEVRGLWHFTQSEKNPDFYQSERFKMQGKYEIVCCRTADKVITISESLKKYLIEKGIEEEKITVLPNGVDTEQLKPLAKDESIIEKYGLQNSKVIGFIGSLTSYEGIELIFDSMKHIKGSKNVKYPLKFIIVGAGQYRSELEKRVEEMGLENDVIFIGRVPHEDVSKFYSVIDIAPFPRKDAPVCHLVTPIKTYEAMSMGKRVVVSDVDALKEMVHEGVNGVVFKAESSEELSKALLKIIEDDKIGTHARNWVTEHREWNVLINKLVPLYKKAN
ncbi:glycosyltransferase family 4 protein [Salinicoccus roseus]|uniref:glycosyltransferase family 4 protein n=1 Tax=Salinicoccus roseus TaxID=45670 RepID=UPI00230128F0|nr:glycosyltransferase family 4 protein [Salinicoccus roseus]